MGKIVRALSEDGSVLCAAINSTDMVEELERVHKSSKAVTAALGRTVTAAAIMGSMLKYEGDRLTLRINGGGPCGTITAVSDYRGNVKCSVTNAKADARSVEELVGADGTFTIIKDMGLKEPYVGQIPLSSGNIARILTEYYAQSEQLPTIFNLGIKFGEDGKIVSAGGFMVQAVPPVTENSIKILEENLAKMDEIDAFLDGRVTLEKIALSALEGLGGEILDSWQAGYFCDCSREKTRGILASLGNEELKRLISEGEKTEVCCHFCDKRYVFEAGELEELIK